MNKAVVKKWIAALRSGDYVQCRGCLRKDNAFCVLGVACDLHAKELGNEWSARTDPGTVLGVKVYMKQSMYLPDEVASWIGMEGYLYLGTLNDKGMSFTELATHIESRLDKGLSNLWY